MDRIKMAKCLRSCCFDNCKECVYCGRDDCLEQMLADAADLLENEECLNEDE